MAAILEGAIQPRPMVTHCREARIRIAMSMPPKSPPPPKPEKEPTFQIGQKIGHSNHLTITKLLGRGGFGEVYLAR